MSTKGRDPNKHPAERPAVASTLIGIHKDPTHGAMVYIKMSQPELVIDIASARDLALRLLQAAAASEYEADIVDFAGSLAVTPFGDILKEEGVDGPQGFSQWLLDFIREARMTMIKRRNRTPPVNKSA